jgi:hypothetical protein
MEEDKVKNVILGIALVGMLALPAFAAPPQTAYPGVEEYLPGAPITNQEIGVRNDPAVFQETTLGTSYLPGAAGSPLPIEFGDDIHTSFSTNARVEPAPGSGADFIMSGYGVHWYCNDTNTAHTLIATVNFYENDPADSTLIGPIATYNFTDPNTTPGIRITTVKVDDIQMPADLWMTVQYAFSDGAQPTTRKPGTLLASSADWPENPFPTHNPNQQGAEIGHSDWWFLTNTFTLSYFGSAATAPPGNLLLQVYGRAVPEPATLGLLALSGLALFRRRR